MIDNIKQFITSDDDVFDGKKVRLRVDRFIEDNHKFRKEFIIFVKKYGSNTFTAKKYRDDLYSLVELENHPIRKLYLFDKHYLKLV